eukprot:5240462-Pyramimonas_sp.AAC.1
MALIRARRTMRKHLRRGQATNDPYARMFAVAQRVRKGDIKDMIEQARDVCATEEWRELVNQGTAFTYKKIGVFEWMLQVGRFLGVSQDVVRAHIEGGYADFLEEKAKGIICSLGGKMSKREWAQLKTLLQCGGRTAQ